MLIAATPRLRIRTLAQSDAAFVLELVNEPAFLANIGDRGVRDLDAACRFIAEGPWTRQSRPGHGQFAVELAASGEPVGVCGLLYREALEVTDIGFAFLAAWHGRGLALEAAVAVMDYGRTALGLERIVGITSPANTASIRLLERLGLRFERLVKLSPQDPGTALYG